MHEHLPRCSGEVPDQENQPHRAGRWPTVRRVVQRGEKDFQSPRAGLAFGLVGMLVSLWPFSRGFDVTRVGLPFWVFGVGLLTCGFYIVVLVVRQVLRERRNVEN